MKLIKAISICFFGIQIAASQEHPAFYAVQLKDTKALQNILNQNSQSVPLNQDKQTLLHVAVLANNWKSVQIILKSKSVDINQLDAYGKTAMDYAVEYNHKKMIKTLYKNKAQVTSLENANYAQKVITRPFKIVFFIGLSIVSLLFIFVPLANSFGGYKLMTGLFYGITGGIPMIVGGSGWIARSNRNLLLEKAA